MAPPSKDTVQTTFRLDAAAMARATRVAEAMSEPGLPVSPQDALRRSIALGLDLLEAKMVHEGRLSPPTVGPGRTRTSAKEKV